MLTVCLFGHKGYWGKILYKTLQKFDLNILPIDPTSTIKKEQKINEKDFEKVDFCVIATPPKTHYSIAKFCLEKNKHVLIEKPFTINPQEAKDLLNINKSKILGVDHTFLFSEHIREIKKQITEGKIGKLLRIDSNRHNLGKFQDDGVILDLMPHDLSVTNWILENNNPKINYVFKKGHIDPSVIDTAFINLSYGEVTYTLNISWLYPKKVRSTVFIGDKGMIEYDLCSSSPIKIYDKVANKVDKHWTQSYNYITEYQNTIKEPLQLMFEEFIDCIVNNKKFISDGEFSLPIVNTINQIGIL